MRHLLLVLLVVGCGRDPQPGDSDTDTPTPPTHTPPDTITDEGTVVTPPFEDPLPSGALKVALIGDFGVDDENEAAVAELVADFEPDAILTMGDNNYPSGSEATMDDNIGKYYAAFIHPYVGEYGPGGEVNRFWPSLGNHDWQLGTLDPYLAYFDLPHNERYYSVNHGVLETFAVDSDMREPDGNARTSVQAAWLRDALAASTAPWKLVYMHDPPFTSGSHGSNARMEWPWGAWGVDFVWAGHDHHYESIERHGVLFGVNGIGGVGLRNIYPPPVDGSMAAHTASHGATLATFTEDEARFVTVDDEGAVIDDIRVVAGRPLSASVPLVHAQSDWRYLDTGVAPSADWTLPGFDDSGWDEGGAQLGYGDGDEVTVVQHGTASADKHVTTWFRRSFTVDHLDTWDALELGILANDGAVVHLNGVEVYRVGLPAGPVTPETLATLDVAVETFATVELPVDALVEGDNVLAVEVHLASPTADDLGFDLWLDARQDDRPVPFGSTWRYDDDGVAAVDWFEPDHDDDTWSVGAAPFGYGGESPVATVIDPDGDPLDRKITTWYRHTFEVADARAVDALLMELVRADGAVVYLNGTQVYRSNVPRSKALTNLTRASHPIHDAWVDRPVRSYLDPDLLVDGANTVAVAIRVASPDAPLHRFDMSLVTFP